MIFLDKFNRLLSEDFSLNTKVDLLSLLNEYPITGELLFEAAQTLMKRATYLADKPLFAVDIVGTGGDNKGLFNISTTAAFIMSGAGIPVIKHGNVGVSGRSGSMDCLQALNVKLPTDASQALYQFETLGLSFIFASLFYPVLSNLKAARKVLAERGEKTIFNLLGPLVNPFCPLFQAIGVYRAELMQPFAEAMQGLGRQGFVFHCEDSDELLLSDQLEILRVRRLEIRNFSVSIRDLGLAPALPETLLGGEPTYNASLTLNILRNEETGPKRQVALLNAMMGILAYDPNYSVGEAYAKAEEALRSGAALAKLESLQ